MYLIAIRTLMPRYFKFQRDLCLGVRGWRQFFLNFRQAQDDSRILTIVKNVAE